MAKKIVINENDNDNVKIIGNVSKLVTYKSDGETCTWIPEDETRLVTKAIIKDGTYIVDDELGSPYGYSQVTVNGVGNKVLGQLGEKSITKNGTYIAENDSAGPFYGYSRVVVDIEGGSSGDGGGGSTPVVGKDDDGDDAEVKTDDDGTIVVEKLPTRISISVYPNNLVYDDGQLIDFTGLKVKAFLPNDTEWGIVDDDELIKPVTVAEAGEGEEVDVKASIENVSLLQYPENNPISISTMASGTKYYAQASTTDTPMGYIFKVEGNSTMYVVSVLTDSSHSNYALHIYSRSSFSTYRSWGRFGDNESEPSYYDNASLIHSDIIGDYYIGRLGTSGEVPAFPENIFIDNLYSTSDFAIQIFGGTITGGSQQTIPFQWKRPGDGKVLETSFTISVHASDDSGDSGGGSGPEPAPTPPSS